MRERERGLTWLDAGGRRVICISSRRANRSNSAPEEVVGPGRGLVCLDMRHRREREAFPGGPNAPEEVVGPGRGLVGLDTGKEKHFQAGQTHLKRLLDHACCSSPSFRCPRNGCSSSPPTTFDRGSNRGPDRGQIGGQIGGQIRGQI